MWRTCCTPFSIESLQYDAQTADYYYAGRSARALMDGALVAQFGQLHPDIAASRKLRQSVFIAEVYLDRLYATGLARSPLPAFAALSGGRARFFICLRRRSDLRKDPAQLSSGSAWRNCAALFRQRFSAEATFPRESIRCCFAPAFSPPSAPCGKMKWPQWSAQIIKSLESLGGKLRA